MLEPFLVYVACSSAELDRARWMIAAVREEGAEITYDWTAHIEGEPEVISRDRAGAIADLDIDGVTRADLVIWICPPPGRSPGAWFELGGGVIAGVPVLAVLPCPPSEFDWRKYIFASKARFFASEDDEALGMVREMIAARRAELATGS